MAAVTRQPFAPLSEARLQTLTSLKSRQNVIANTSPSKRKASEMTELSNLENVDPSFYSKRAKGSIKPSTVLLSKSASTNDLPISSSIPLKPSASRPRTLLNPKSPSGKFDSNIASRSPLTAPAGRSPTRGKRCGILSSRRRTGGSFTRIDPPVYGLATHPSAAPFSLDAAIKGTISSHNGRSDTSFSKKPQSRLSNYGGLYEPEMKSSWFFDIHEDTEEQEMTNLLQHSTCVLDISSDEESESRRQREHAEGKENVPPVDDVSQTTRLRAARLAPVANEIVIEKERSPLGEMDPKEYYSAGCDENSIIIIPADEDEESLVQNDNQLVPETVAKPSKAEVELKSTIEAVSTEEKLDQPAPNAAVLAPIEGTGESFEVWESSSAKDEAESATEA